jgi:hypothetical protein
VAQAHQQWEQLVAIVLSQRGAGAINAAAAAQRPQLSLAQTLRQHAQQSAIRSQLQPELEATVAAAEEWQETLRKALAKRNSPLKLEKWLQVGRGARGGHRGQPSQLFGRLPTPTPTPTPTPPRCKQQRAGDGPSRWRSDTCLMQHPWLWQAAALASTPPFPCAC